MEDVDKVKTVIEYIEGRVDRLFGNYDEIGAVRQASISQLLLTGHIIVKAYGTEDQEQEYLEYKQIGLLENLEISKEVTQDTVYGMIKNFEYLSEYLVKGDNVSDGEYRNYHQVVSDILEYLSGVFNNWEQYEDIVNRQLVSNEMKEYTYEELVGEDIESEKEEYQPQTRAERRELERKRARLNRK